MDVSACVCNKYTHTLVHACLYVCMYVWCVYTDMNIYSFIWCTMQTIHINDKQNIVVTTHWPGRGPRSPTWEVRFAPSGPGFLQLSV